MRPIRLEIENFTVYRGRHLIDFSPLSFFVIKGKTGAGKSSLIDAICYALYGRVPRYGGRKAHDHLLAKGQREMRVILDFSVRGKSYRIEREYIQGKKKGISEFRFYEEGIRRNFREEELENFLRNLIKLDYETFIKVILLPQNQFDKLLKPEDKSKRREILNSLLGLSETILALKELIKMEYDKVKTRLDLVKASLEDLSSVTLERLNQIENQITQIEKEYEVLSKEKPQWEDLLKTCEERDRLRVELEKVMESLERLRGREEEIEEKKKRLELALELQPYRQKIEEYERIDREERENKDRKIKLELELRKYRDEEEIVKEEFEKVKGEFKRLDEYNMERVKIGQVVPKIEECLRLLKEIEDVKGQLERVEGELTHLLEKRKNCEVRLEKGRRLMEELQKEIRAYEEGGIEERIREVERLKEQIKRLESLSKEIGDLEKDMEELKRNLRDQEELLARKKEEYERVKEEGKRLEEEIQSIKGELEQEIELVMKEKDLTKLLDKLGELERVIEEKSLIEGKIKDLEDEIRKRDKYLSQLESKRLEIYTHELKAKLKEGDICPVCGGKVSSLDTSMQKEDIEAILTQLRKAQEDKSRLERELSRHLANLESLFERERSLKEDLKDYTRESLEEERNALKERLDYLHRIKRELQKKEELFKRIREREERLLKDLEAIRIRETQLREKMYAKEDYMNKLKEDRSYIASSLPENCEEYIRKIERDYEEYKALREKEKNYQRKLEELKEELSQVEKGLVELEERKKNLSLQREEKSKRLEGLEQEVYQRLKEKPSLILKQRLENKAKELEERVKEVQEKYEKTREYLSHIEKVKEKLQSDIRNIEENLKRLKDRKRVIAKELFPFFESFGELEKIKEYSLDQGAIRELQEEIESYNKEVYSLREKEREIREKIKSCLGLPETEKVKENLQKLDEKIHKNRELFGSLRQELDQIKAKLEEKGKLQKEYEALSYELGLYERLKKDFTDNRFPNYISQLMLRMLTERANYYFFKFTSGQFSFELLEDDLQIVDHNTGHFRSVYSLSGGETFLASLSLAFSMADLLSQDAPIESLFIDEGFGSLDRETRESLGEFFNIIRESTSRMVGIITHMEDIAERFAQRIEVEKKGNSARISVIY